MVIVLNILAFHTGKYYYTVRKQFAFIDATLYDIYTWNVQNNMYPNGIGHLLRVNETQRWPAIKCT